MNHTHVAWSTVSTKNIFFIFLNLTVIFSDQEPHDLLTI